MKFLSKKLVLAAVLAMVGVCGVSANPAKALLAKHKADLAAVDSFYAIEKAKISGLFARFNSDLNKNLNPVLGLINLRSIEQSGKVAMDLEIKITSLIKAIDEEVVEVIKKALNARQLNASPENYELVVKNGFRGGIILNAMLSLVPNAPENDALRKVIAEWSEFHAKSFDVLFARLNPKSGAPVKAGASMFNPLNWFKTAPKTAAPAVPAPVEVVEPAVVLDTVWFDDAINGANVLVSSKTVTEEARKKELDKNLFVALNAWIVNPANVASKMAELKAVANMDSKAVRDYLNSLEILIASPVVDDAKTVAAYMANARAQWKKGNAELDRAFVLITKIELNAAEAAK